VPRTFQASTPDFWVAAVFSVCPEAIDPFLYQSLVPAQLDFNRH